MDSLLVKRYSLSKQVSDQLEDMIKKGKYKIGEKIPTESELMELFNVSRNTIREAIKYLASAGLLDVRQGDGTYIKSDNRFDANMKEELKNNSFKDINEARKSIEGCIVSLACQRRTEKDLKDIKKALDNRKNFSSSLKENSIADVNFHIAIAKACHNNILFDLYKSLYSYLIQNVEEKLKYNEVDPKTIDQLHEDLYLAIVNKNQEDILIIIKKILES